MRKDDPPAHLQIGKFYVDFYIQYKTTNLNIYALEDSGGSCITTEYVMTVTPLEVNGNNVVTEYTISYRHSNYENLSPQDAKDLQNLIDTWAVFDTKEVMRKRVKIAYEKLKLSIIKLLLFLLLFMWIGFFWYANSHPQDKEQSRKAAEEFAKKEDIYHGRTR